MDNGSNSTWRPLLESVLGHVLLTMSLSDLGEAPECPLVEGADDAKWGGPGNTLEGKGCRPAGPRPAGGTGWQEPYAFVLLEFQSPALGKEGTLAAIPSGACLAGEQLCWRGP